jgi:hypothetical protein
MKSQLFRMMSCKQEVAMVKELERSDTGTEKQASQVYQAWRKLGHSKGEESKGRENEKSKAGTVGGRG